MAAEAPSKLGKYEIRGTLGKGAMGIVYDGFDPVIERHVAIKTIAKQSMDPTESAALLGRFKREAQAAGRLNHPCIVSIHDYGEDDGLAFIAMEFIRGNELRQYFESQQRFLLKHIARIMCDVLDALDHAHRNGVVHRDIKPANIMITDEGRVKVADFGVARIESSMMTQVGMRIGTPAYMSPEQHQGLPVSGRSDIFSAGVILYEFLTGQRPFTGDGYAIVPHILSQDPIAPSEINADIPPALDAVIMKALAKRPEDRFATACEFAEALRAATTGAAVGTGVDILVNDAGWPLGSGDAIALPAPPRGTSTSRANAIGSGSNPFEVSLEAELEYWKEIKDSSEAADFQTFLQTFPASRFAPLARRRLNRLVDGRGERDVDEPGRAAAAERTRIDSAHASAAEEDGCSRDRKRQREEAQAQARRQAEEKRQRAEAQTQLLAEADSRRAAEASARKQTADQAQNAAVSKRAAARAHRDGDWRFRHLDGQEPTLILSPAGEANALMPAMDRSPRIVEQSFPSAVDPPRLKTVVGPVHARRRVAQSAHTNCAAVPAPHSFAAGTARKPSRLPILAALAALLLASGLWYATRPELAPVVGMLRTEAQSMLGQLREQWPAPEAQQTVQERRGDAAARVAEEQRKNSEAVTAERNRQLAMTRQKEEAARAVTMQNYQRAIILLDQGNASEGVRLLRQLAHSGHGPAAKTLGDLYSSGEKVLLDRQEASYFYAIAERNGVRPDHPPVVRR